MSGRNNQVLRILKAFQLLENSRFGLSTKQIWQELIERGWEVNQRTVYRDLQALEAAGFPLIEAGEDAHQATTWKIKADTSFGQHLNLSVVHSNTFLKVAMIAAGYTPSFPASTKS